MKHLKLAVAAVLALAVGSAYGQATEVNFKSPINYLNTNALTGFHAGGVAACEGCHVMHNASDGQAMTVKSGTGVPLRSDRTNSYLLQGSDQSSTCLICHRGNAGTNEFTVLDTSATVSSSTTNFTPGGDFAWLNVTGAGATPTPGNRHGHSIYSGDFSVGGIAATAITAPGSGTTPWRTGTSGTSQFACTSCHDPHGKYRMTSLAGVLTIAATGAPITQSGSYGLGASAGTTIPAGTAIGVYRLLGGKLYKPASNASASTFSQDPPIAVAPQNYNRSESGSEVRVAYGTGMSEWCANCHGNLHMPNTVTGAPGTRHVTGNAAILKETIAANYNTYLSSGNMNGAATGTYTSLVPFESQVTTISGGPDTLYGGAQSTSGTPAIFQATAAKTVMCLSCHRAHASGFSSMTRWSNLTTFLTTAGGGFTAQEGLDATQAQIAYYMRPVSATALTATGYGFGPNQRSLCNKCHAKD